jgi:hypothetical protein
LAAVAATGERLRPPARGPGKRDAVGRNPFGLGRAFALEQSGQLVKARRLSHQPATQLRTRERRRPQVDHLYGETG